MARVKTWVWVVVGIVTMGILGVIAMAAAGLWFVKSHVAITATTSAAATADFQTIRDRFANQPPLIELDDRGNLLHANTDRAAGSSRPETLDIMVFDPKDDRVIRIEIPFWLLRLKLRDTRIDVGHSNLDLAKLRLTVDDLERFGPTLLVDHHDADGARVLVWSQ
jgi:hypothetical protein